MSVFKQRIFVGPGYTPGVSNVQLGGVHGLDKADTLWPPNKNWRCTLDPNQWALFDAHATWKFVFLKVLPHPDRVILEADGRLHIVDTNNKTVWERGPFGESALYELKCEDAGDIALYNAKSDKLWSAVRDGVD
jgi:hypothetical protein